MTVDLLDSSRIIDSAKRVIAIERDAMNTLATNIDERFVGACQHLLQCKGKVVVTGMGKSGHVGHKIAATFASTGTPSFFMHPAEANHGDLGMLSGNDLLLAISHSGETSEVLNLLPVIKRLDVPVIAMTGNASSSLASQSDVVLDISVEKEACSLGLAPTTSTTVTLVLGDALAVSLLEARGFTADDFAMSHPGGSLGRKLLLKVSDIMTTSEHIPLVNSNASISSALMEVSSKGLGFTGVIDEQSRLVGIFTDGDLRRVLDQRVDLHATAISEVMTQGGITVHSGQLAVDALNIMEEKRISSLIAVNEKSIPIGAFNMHMLLRAGVV
jgi:arabinose-5-phosphate isomerase